MADEELYERAAREWSAGVRDQALLAKAATKAKFDEKETVAGYIEERVKQLRRQDADDANYNRQLRREQERQRRGEKLEAEKAARLAAHADQAKAASRDRDLKLWDWKRKTAGEKAYHYLYETFLGLIFVCGLIIGLKWVADFLNDRSRPSTSSTPIQQPRTQQHAATASQQPTRTAEAPLDRAGAPIESGSTTDSYDLALSAFERRHPEINPDSPYYDAARTDGIAARMNQYMDRGMTKVEALRAAIRDTYGP